MDFRAKKKVGQDLFEDYESLNIAGGYDHNWCLNNAGEYKKVVEFSSQESGITMEVYTDRPGVHIYGGAYLVDELGKNGCVYGKYQGICFETQAYPDAINQPNFPTTIVKAGEIYRTRTMYKFI
jgi:aldose 1-epimerase